MIDDTLETNAILSRNRLNTGSLHIKISSQLCGMVGLH